MCVRVSKSSMPKTKETPRETKETSRKTKETFYEHLVRPLVEYASSHRNSTGTLWSPTRERSRAFIVPDIYKQSTGMHQIINCQAIC